MECAPSSCFWPGGAETTDLLCSCGWSQLSQPHFISLVIAQAPVMHCGPPAFSPSQFTWTVFMIAHRGMMTRVTFHWSRRSIVSKPSHLCRKTMPCTPIMVAVHGGIWKTWALVVAMMEQVQKWLYLCRMTARGRVVRKALFSLYHWAPLWTKAWPVGMPQSSVLPLCFHRHPSLF